MQFNPAKFNALLSVQTGLAQHLTWAKAALCPCRNPTSGAARKGCPNCGGRGVSWGSPVPAWSGLAGMKIAREWANFGLWESGDVVMTVPSDSPFYAAGENDRVQMTDSSEPFSLILTRGHDKLTFTAKEIDRVWWLDQTTQTLVDGGIPVEAADGTLTWPTGTTAPPAGVQYSISGRKVPEYYLFRDFPQDRAHSGGLPLPRRVVLRRFDLFGR